MIRSTSCGSTAPSVSCSPTSTWAPSSTRMRERRDILSMTTSSEPSSGVMVSFRNCSPSSMRRMPASSAIGALPLGTRASKSSTTRGRPCVMSAPATPPVWEGAHRQLGAGLTDRLGGDDADRLADVHELARRQRPAVAGGAGTQQRLAGQDAPDLDLRDTGRDEVREQHVTQVGAGLRDDRPVLGHRVGGEGTGVDAGLDMGVAGQLTVDDGADGHDDAAVGAAVLLADDDVLRDVDQPGG